MRKFSYLLILLVISGTIFFASAQQARIVMVDGWAPPFEGDPATFNNLLYDAIEADSTLRKSNPNVIYELKRGHKYPLGKIIENYDYHLHIRAEGGSGAKPELIPGKEADGTYGAGYIIAHNDLTLEGIVFKGYSPDGSYLNKMVEARGKHSRYTVKACLFESDREAGIVISADSMKVYISDVVVGNSGHHKTIGGGGRFVDLRPAARYLDTLVVKNSTVNNISDRIIRNMGSVVNYLEIDHLTALNTVGYHGALQLGHVSTAKVTNSLFANVISLGHVDSRTAEQTHPEKHLSVISLDTVFDGQIIEVRNNNIYNDQELIDVWAQYGSVSAPWPITPTIETAIGATNVERAYFEEPLFFAQSCGPLSAFVGAYYTDPSAAELPENWCVEGDGGYPLDEADLSYSTSSVSYTAADLGYPVGNLNYFPEKKSAWEGEPNTAVGLDNFTNMIKVYPNPAKDIIYLQFSNNYNKRSESAIKILNTLGEVKFESNFREQIFEIDLSTIGQAGLYFIQIFDHTNRIVDVRKIILE